jgi:hypothetical protein
MDNILLFLQLFPNVKIIVMLNSAHGSSEEGRWKIWTLSLGQFPFSFYIFLNFFKMCYLILVPTALRWPHLLQGEKKDSCWTCKHPTAPPISLPEFIHIPSSPSQRSSIPNLVQALLSPLWPLDRSLTFCHKYLLHQLSILPVSLLHPSLAHYLLKNKNIV